MVDPDGHIFFSHGLANVRMANLTTFTGIDFKDPAVRYVDPSEVTPEDSIGIVNISDAARETRYVANELRSKMFTWLPAYGDELADHYSFRRSAIMGPMLEGGETYNFYRANLERRYGETEPESYMRTWEQVTLDRMNAWGFTSFGNWVDPAFYPNEQVPYFANGWIIGDYKVLASPHDVWAPMPDPFDPVFVERADITIAVIADEIQGSPWCVGIFVDNEKSWGFREGTVEQRYGIIMDGLSKSADESPAKSAFAGILRDKYDSIDNLNEAWETAFGSWDEFAAGATLEDHNDAVVADMSLLLEALSDEYFRVVHDTVEKYLPNHLYMGARMANWGMPDETIKAAVTYSDVMSFNIYEEGMQPHAWEFLDDIDLPTVIGEFHIGAISDTGLYHPGLVQAADQADRAQMYLAYMESVAALPSMVGAHWFQYVDSPLTGRAFDGEGYNVGFVTVTDIPYPEMVEAAKAFNKNIYPETLRRDGMTRLLAALSLMATATSNASEYVTGRVGWGEFDGRPVSLFTITNPSGAILRMTDYGAKIVELHVPGRDGKLADVVLGFDNLEQYIAPNQSIGATIGRYTNRIRNGRFEIDGVIYELTKNEGPNTIHGAGEFENVVWDAEFVSTEFGEGLRFRYSSPDGTHGFPGTLDSTVTFILTPDNAVHITLEAETDKATHVNMTQHSYFNLNGASDTIHDHVATIHASPVSRVR